MTFQDPIIRAGLYYTSGMESFISCMETNALMGMNIARLIVDEAFGVMSGAAVTSENTRIGADDQQGILRKQQPMKKQGPVPTSHESLQEEL
jgi:prenylcysteine oxidase/farnesylcysteine lyase